MHYPYYETLLAPARPKAQIWRLIIGLILGTVIYYVGVLYTVSSLMQVMQMSTAELTATFDVVDTPFWTGVMLFSFIFMGLPVFLVTEILHKRRWTTLFAHWQVEKRVFLVVTLTLILLAIALELLPPWNLGLLQSNPQLNFSN